MISETELVPSSAEKRRIRRLYSRTGLALIAQYLLMMILAVSGFAVFEPFIKEEFTEDGYAVIGFAEASVMFCAPAAASIIVFLVYSLASKTKISSLFDKREVSRGFLLKTVGVCLFAHLAGGLLQLLVMYILTSLGYDTPDLDFVLADDAPTNFMNVFTSVLLAPAAEELLFRGVLLKETARVSQRFGIVLSAVIFGLMHGNPYQFVLGTLIGLVLGYVTVKSGSLIPAIIGHAAVNTAASVSDIAMFIDESLYDPAYYIVCALEFVIGTAVLVKVIAAKEIKLPPYTAYHKKRTLPVMLTSVPMLVIFAVYIYDMISSVAPIEETEAALRLILQR
ncbi:MAG: CPBP family intramembrane metalloprotease [Oscillospiraceae bacterium]|nr:CPBP family intramembrane metalloprotease [Oscillospiraceae bacterium]